MHEQLGAGCFAGIAVKQAVTIQQVDVLPAKVVLADQQRRGAQRAQRGTADERALPLPAVHIRVLLFFMIQRICGAGCQNGSSGRKRCCHLLEIHHDSSHHLL